MDGQSGSEGQAAGEIAGVQTLAAAVRDVVQRVIVGKSAAIDLAIAALLAWGHVLIEDKSGTGKTTLSKAMVSALRCNFGRVQFTPDLVPSDVLGVNIFDMNQPAFEFRHGPIFTQLLLVDEINRATPRTQSALLEAMQSEKYKSTARRVNCRHLSS